MNIGLSSRKYPSGIKKKSSDPLLESFQHLNGHHSPSKINSVNHNQGQGSQLQVSSASQKKNEKSDVNKATTS